MIPPVLHRPRGAVTLLLLIGLHAMAVCQTFNVDIDVGIGDQQGGNGAPSSTFGGAANSPGYWNRINALGPRDPVDLRGLDGSDSLVQLQASGGLAGGYGYDNFANSGDFALMLNDGASVWDLIDYHVTNLSPGRYYIYTYAVDPSGLRVDATVTVPGADIPVEHVTGPMPGNQFIEGITHTVHAIDVTGSLDIDVSGPRGYTSVNGFQIVAVPEPASILAFAGGLALLLRRRRDSTVV